MSLLVCRSLLFVVLDDDKKDHGRSQPPWTTGGPDASPREPRLLIAGCLKRPARGQPVRCHGPACRPWLSGSDTPALRWPSIDHDPWIVT
jgi:hypothetical protein